MGTDETAAEPVADRGFWNTTKARTISFHVSGLPVPQGSMRGFVVKGRAILTSSSKGLSSWRQLVSLRAQEIAGEPFNGPVSIHLEFLLPKPKSAPKRKRIYATKRPDIDKLSRSVLDSITHVLIVDDSQVVELTAIKDYGPPGVHVTVTEIAV
jgi:crossover junction endodeoxyribonuclease RusA